MAKGCWRSRRACSKQATHIGGGPVYDPNLSWLTSCVCYSLQRLCGLCQFSWSVRTPNYPSEEAKGGEGESCQTSAPGGMLPSDLQRLQRFCKLQRPLLRLLQRLLPSPAHPQHTSCSPALLKRAPRSSPVSSQGTHLFKPTPEPLQPTRRPSQLPS